VIARRRVGWAEQAWLVFRKDLLIEISTREIITTSGFFAVLLAVIGARSFYFDDRASRAIAPGIIWVTVAFASVLALSRSWQRERENDALAGLLVMPVARSAIFAGKALGILLFVLSIELLTVLTTALLLGIALGEVWLGLAALSLCATPAVAAAGTLFGAMTVRTSARDLVLASVLFPLLAPTLITATVATRDLFAGIALADLGDYFVLMGVFAFLFIAGGLGMFASLIES
jgi:heme exporter protein B